MKKRRIDLIGAGMGNAASMTREALEALGQAQAVFGSKRLLEGIPLLPGQERAELYRPEDLLAYLQEHPDLERAAVLLSGDTGFYSGAKRLLDHCKAYQLELYPGISTVSYLAARLGVSWEEFYFCSLHGRRANVIGAVLRKPWVFVLLSDAGQLAGLAKDLLYFGLGHVRLAAGSNLGGREEKVINFAPPEEFLDFQEPGMHTAVIRNEEARQFPSTYGISDEAFIRGEVPMTKSELRAITLSKLRLCPDSLVYDIGAGTGSVSVECARIAWQGQVFAFERNPKAVSLIRQNRQKFQAANLQVLHGQALDLLKENDLPLPDRAFIGGSGGGFPPLAELLFEKNPDLLMVVNTVTLESLDQVLSFAAGRGLKANYTQVSISRARPVGNYHMLQAQNPVTVIELSVHDI